MTTGNGSQSAAQEKRKLLLDAAAREFIENGYAATTLASVAGRLDLTKGALAHHFPTKDALLVGLAEALSECNKDSQRLSRAAYPDSGLHAGVTFMLHLGAKAAVNPQLAAALVLITDRGATSNKFAEATLEWISMFQGFLDQAQAADQIAADLDTEHVAQFMLATNIGSTLLPNTSKVIRNRQKRVRFMRLGLRSLGVADADAVVDEILATGANNTLQMPDRTPNVIPGT